MRCTSAPNFRCTICTALCSCRSAATMHLIPCLVGGCWLWFSASFTSNQRKKNEKKEEKKRTAIENVSHEKETFKAADKRLRDYMECLCFRYVSGHRRTALPEWSTAFPKSGTPAHRKKKKRSTNCFVRCLASLLAKKKKDTSGNKRKLRKKCPSRKERKKQVSLPQNSLLFE